MNQRSQFTHLASASAVFYLCIQKSGATCKKSGIFSSYSVPTYRTRTITKKCTVPTRASAEKFSGGGPIRMEPVLTTKNGRIFEIWELLERVCENPGGGHGPPCPPLPTPMRTNVPYRTAILISD